ncbi:MAG: hypothetical protein K6G50_10455 [bacterium]|nr:hypothetical protein [bacterium]
MGTGIHGGFGKTYGARATTFREERRRVGKPVNPSEKTYEMALNPLSYVYFIARKYNIHLRGSGREVKIVYDDTISTGTYGKVFKDEPNVIYIGHDAIRDEEQLANTIAHELNHARSYLKNGVAPEKTAYPAGNRLAKYIRGII